VPLSDELDRAGCPLTPTAFRKLVRNWFASLHAGRDVGEFLKVPAEVKEFCQVVRGATACTKLSVVTILRPLREPADPDEEAPQAPAGPDLRGTTLPAEERTAKPKTCQTFAEFFEMIRSEKGWSAARLGKEIGEPAPTVHDILDGSVAPSAETLRRALAAVGKPWAWLDEVFRPAGA
jgi:hypothetical protein